GTILRRFIFLGYSTKEVRSSPVMSSCWRSNSRAMRADCWRRVFLP
ncbi:uncharacterized protein METZ01_LOCUS425703, partial [marine metagenome]